ncbi:MAG TPA: phosphatidylglycerophosphatase A [Bryobacteraceae bacterium]|nr:phosphatidylglycerophosphatase A [Bryobacteraceae bacterium]
MARRSAAEVAALVFATCFGCGYFPLAPGTIGSAAAVLVAWGLHAWLAWPPLAFGLIAALLIVPSVLAAGRVALMVGRKDPGLVVIDEVLGQWITIAGAVTLNWRSWLAAFALFRLLDIWKPPPARRLESLPGGAGIVADDMMAGVYGSLVLLLAGWCNLY